jgi:hypothetical protein
MTRYVVLRGFLAIRSPVLRKSQLRKSQVGARYIMPLNMAFRQKVVSLSCLTITE